MTQEFTTSSGNHAVLTRVPKGNRTVLDVEWERTPTAEDRKELDAGLVDIEGVPVMSFTEEDQDSRSELFETL